MQEPLPFPSAAICGDQLHIIGSGTHGYSCSLLQPVSQPPLHSMSPASTWRDLPTLPQMDSTAATLWRAGSHRWRVWRVITLLYTPASGPKVGGDLLLGYWEEEVFGS